MRGVATCAGAHCAVPAPAAVAWVSLLVETIREVWITFAFIDPREKESGGFVAVSPIAARVSERSWDVAVQIAHGVGQAFDGGEIDAS